MPEVCLYVPRQLDTHKHTPRQSGVQSILSRARGSGKVQSPLWEVPGGCSLQTKLVSEGAAEMDVQVGKRGRQKQLGQDFASISCVLKSQRGGGKGS